MGRYVTLAETRRSIVEQERCTECGQILFTKEYAEKHRKAHATRPSANYPKPPTSRSPIIQAKKERIDRRRGPRSPEVREKMRAALNRPEVREKMRAALNRPEVREKMRAAAIRTWSRPEVREKMRAAAIRTWSRPEVREKMRATWRSKRIARLRAQLKDLENPPEVRVVTTPPAEPNAFHRLEG
jgi:hypothetical protein